MSTLYRVFRPQKFSEVIGQTVITTTLQNAVAAGQISHGYIFTGGRGTGKTTVARILAKALNCLHPVKGDACDNCEHCKAIIAGTFLDVVEIDAASHTSVEHVRELIEQTRFQPSRGTYTVFIIDEVHMLSKAAFNALLKTLEEPPQHVVFIMATTEAHKVPATILSRSQRFHFKNFSVSELSAYIIEVSGKNNTPILPEIAENIAKVANGGMRDALVTTQQIIDAGAAQNFEHARLLLGLTAADAIGDLIASFPEPVHALQKLQDFPAPPLLVTKQILQKLHELLLNSVSKPTQESSNSFSVFELQSFIRLWLKAYKDLEYAPDSEIVFLHTLVACAEVRHKNTIPSAQGNGVHAAKTFPNGMLPKEPATTSQGKQGKLKEIHISGPSVNTATDKEAELNGNEEQSVIPVLQLHELQLHWRAILKAAQEAQPTLLPFINCMELVDIANNTIFCEVRYAIHRRQLQLPHHSRAILHAIETFTKTSCTISFQEPQATAVTFDGPATALQVFEGEYVDL